MNSKKLKTTLLRAKDIFLDFASKTSIHGVKYFGCPDRNWCEKFFWMTVFGLSVCSGALLIRKVYDKWDQTPVIVSFDEKFTPVWQIPFPAVTICPEVKTPITVMNFTKEFHLFMEQSFKRNRHQTRDDTLLAMMQLCDRTNILNLISKTMTIPNKRTGESYASLIRLLNIPQTEMLDDCIFLSERFNCSELFSYTLTEEGVCLTFNILSAKDMLRTNVLQSSDPYITEQSEAPYWSLELGYSRQANITSYPRRTLGPGYSAGLSLFLRSDLTNHDYLCRGPIHGFKILLHSSSEFPQVTNKFIRIPMNHEVTVAVKPEKISTNDGLQGYSPERRQCFFNSERHLQFFRVYNQANCELECLTNFTLLRCGCVKFSMPRTSATPECEINQFWCMWNAEIELLEMGPIGHKFEELNFRAKCNCLPACTSVQYDTEITQANFDWMKWARTMNVSAMAVRGLEISRLGIYYKESQFMTSKRSELYGLTDFLANCGGLLGLCMGMSLLSLVELFYFCFIRPFALWGQQGDKKQIEHDRGSSVVDEKNIAVKGD
ncbi:pickpocket protein 28-like [Armigeres subalbatus]|uniref:pickpocket protein 28-like n=1 Tax=Armigeres subalbatus TaxID=124917 RepID=UPI002ED16700